jgi:hypothetical protein
VLHLAKTTTPGQSVEQRIATLLAAPGLAASPLRARAHEKLLHVGKVVCNNSRTCRICRAACSGKLAPLHDAALRRARQARSVRGSRQGPRRTPREAVRLTAKPCVRSEMGCCRTIAGVRCFAACSTACCNSLQCCAYLARPAAAVSNRALCARQAPEALELPAGEP